MTDHWEGIVAAVIIAGMAILSRLLFVLKKDCDDHRATCSQTICGKINDLQNRASDAAQQRIALDKEAKQTLKEINIAILELNKSTSQLRGGFDLFLREMDKRK